MFNSVSTNLGAMAALQSLGNTQASLMETQHRVSTGQKVQDMAGYDAGSVVTQYIQRTSSSLTSANQELAAAKGVVDTAVAAASEVSGSLTSLRGVLSQLSNQNLDASKKTELQTQYKSLLSDIDKTIESASSNGFNALGSEIQKVTVNQAGGALEIGGSNLKEKLALPSEIHSAAEAQSLLDANNSNGIDAAQKLVGDVEKNLGAMGLRISAQTQYNSALQSSLQSNLVAMADADLTEGNAQLQSLQVKQQLGVQSLSLANQAPQSLMRLFG